MSQLNSLKLTPMNTNQVVLDQVRRCFMQNSTLDTIKQAQQCYQTYISLFSMLQRAPLLFQPTQYINFQTFSDELYDFLTQNQIVIKKKQYSNTLQQLYEKSKTVPQKIQSPLKTSKSHEDNFQSYQQRTKVIGRSQVVDKVFTRAAEIPDPDLVRTPATLKIQADVLGKYFNEHKQALEPRNKTTQEFDKNYLFLQTRLRACRYDYQVQQYSDTNYCKILLISVQASILADDYSEFNAIYQTVVDNFQKHQVGDINKIHFLHLLISMLGGAFPSTNNLTQKSKNFLKQYLNNQNVSMEKMDRYEKHLLKQLIQRRETGK